MTVSRLLSIIGGNEKRTPAVLEDMLKSLALPRKSSELETAEHDALLKAVESTTNEILRYTKTLYGGDEESRKSQHEMDQHWAAQKAAFQYFVAHKKEYLDFLPGRIFIYMQFAERILQYADKLESFVKKTTPNGAQIV
ncbi:MAG: hypothetical protein KAQ85_02625, partial [Thermodesulfovibrionia bacterium]|nr:hypothetical protein [Thermodesulfovibrionia bacterium]